MQNNYSNMDEKIRDKIHNHEVEVSPFVWETLQDQLTIESFYNKKWFRYLSYAAIFFLTIGFSIAGSQQYFNFVRGETTLAFDQNSHLHQYNNYLIETGLEPQIITQKVEVLKEIYKTIEVPVETNKYLPTYDIEKLLEKYQYLSYTAEEIAQLNEKIELIKSFELSNEPEKNVESVGALSKVDIEQLAIHGFKNKIKPTDRQQETLLLENTGLGMALDGSSSFTYQNEITTQQLVDNILKKKMANLKGFQIGMGGSVFNSWILNKRPTSIPTNSVQYKFTYGSQYGLTMGYNLNPKLGIELSLAKANQGQRIIQYVEGQEIESETRLNYLHVPLAFKYKWEQYSSITKHPIVMNYLFGLQYSKLLSVDGIGNNDIIFLEDLERSHDIGFLVGLDYDIFLSSNYFITIGARSTFSTDLDAFIHSFNGTTNTKTDNFTVGLKASFNYLFRM